MVEYYFQYCEEGVYVATLLVKFRDHAHAVQEKGQEWKNLVQTLPLTFFVKDAWKQLEILNVFDNETPVVQAETLRISLV
jgi:hypothetical protein